MCNFIPGSVRSQARSAISDIVVPGEEGEVCDRVAGHPARFNPKFMGDWTDLEAVLGGLNNAVAEADRPERFANIHSGAKAPTRSSARLKVSRTWPRQVGLPLDDKANAAIAIGMVADDHLAAEI
jgi:hypothetical protein